MKGTAKLLIVFVVLCVAVIPGYSIFNRISPDASAEAMLETAAVATEANRMNYHALPILLNSSMLFAGAIGMGQVKYMSAVSYVMVLGGLGYSTTGLVLSFVKFPAESALSSFNNEREANKDWTQEQRDERALYYLKSAAKSERVWSIVGGMIPVCFGVTSMFVGFSSMSVIQHDRVMSDENKAASSGQVFGLTVLPGVLLIASGIIQAAFVKAPAELVLERYNQSLEDKGSAKLDFYIIPVPGNASAGVCVSF